MIKANKVDCFCAFCKTPRRVYRKRHLTLPNYIQALSLAVFVSFIFFQTIDARGLVFFVIALMFIESSILLRRRMDVQCPHCGFDANLYTKDQAAACEKVKVFLAERQSDPKVWLGIRPPVTVSKPSSKKSKMGHVKGRKSTRSIVV